MPYSYIKKFKAVEDDKVTLLSEVKLSEDSGEKASTPEDPINKALMAEEDDDKQPKKEESDDTVLPQETQNQDSDGTYMDLDQETEDAFAPAPPDP